MEFVISGDVQRDHRVTEQKGKEGEKGDLIETAEYNVRSSAIS